MPDITYIEDTINATVNQAEEANDFIGNPPGWILRSGITVVAMVFAIGMALSYIISYPDKIMAPVVITTVNPPVDMVSKAAGKIDKIFVEDKDIVRKGQNIYYIENTANSDDVEDFFSRYESIRFIPDYLKLTSKDKLITGELSNSVNSFFQKFKEFQNLLGEGIVFQKLKSIDNEISRIQELNRIHGKRVEIYSIEVHLKQKEYDRNQILHRKNVISDSEREKYEAEYLTYKRQLESMNSNIVSNNIRIEQLRTQQLELTAQRKKQVRAYINQLAELKTTVKNQIKSWREKYYITTPIDGVVTIPTTIHQNMFVNQGMQVCSVIPDNTATIINKKIAMAMTPISGVGKIEKGSKTIIRFDAYPYKEFGSMDTAIDDIALLPVKDKEGKAFYNITINLPDTLKTNYDKIIPYRPNMSGVAMIITKDRTIFERLFEKFLDLVKNR